MTSTHSNSNKKDGSNYIFFWKVPEKYGWASQWYPSTFTADISFGPLQGQRDTGTTSGRGAESGAESVVKATFPTAEHWMMTQKALLFGDYEVARKVLAITGSGRGECAKVKALGREVRGFEKGVWERARESIVLKGTLLKFKQNEELRRKLEATGDKKMVEASPRDKVWGIGMGWKEAIEVVKRDGEKGWKGQNLLGKALNEAREVLRKEKERDGT